MTMKAMMTMFTMESIIKDGRVFGVVDCENYDCYRIKVGVIRVHVVNRCAKTIKVFVA